MQISYDGKFRKKVPFAAVSVIALDDENLSFQAKGLYALIQRYITLQDKNFVLYKSMLLGKSTNGIRSFNTAWDELKNAGYLKQFRIREEKGFRYEYDLLDEPDLETPSTINIKLDGSISEKGISTEENTEKAQEYELADNADVELFEEDSATEVETVGEPLDDSTVYASNNRLSALQQNESTNSFMKNDKSVVKNKSPNDQIFVDVNRRLNLLDMPYPDKTLPEYLQSNDLYSIRDLVVEILTSHSSKIRINGEMKNGDEVRKVFEKFEYKHFIYLEESLDKNQTEITNVKSYLVTSIYNAVITYDIQKLFLSNK